jgi:hypothetical protein
MEVAKEVVATVTDPQAMLGPEVCMYMLKCVVERTLSLRCRLGFLMIKYHVTILPSKKRRGGSSSLKYLKIASKSNRLLNICCGC